jgi:uncharacterized iron-regulated membrane protein
MRKTHRWIGFLAAACLAPIAASGVYLQANALWDAVFPAQPDPGTILPRAQLPTLVARAITAADRAAPGRKLTSLRLTAQGGQLRADVTLAPPHARLLSFDATTGEPYRGNDTGTPGNSLRERVWAVAFRLHRGDILGAPGHWIGLLCGLALLTLAVSGLIIYTQLFRQRLKLRRRALFW